MVAVLVLAIAVLVLAGLLVAARSRAGTDPSSSVVAFNRALRAMEPGATRDREPGATRDREAPGADGDDEAHASDRAHPAR